MSMREGVKKPEAILFDLDDTLILNAANKNRCWKSVMDEFADELKDYGQENVLSEILKEEHWFWGDEERHKKWRMDLNSARREIVTLALGKIDINDSDLSRRMADRCSVLRDESITLVQGAVETLLKLEEHGIKLGLVTNGSSKAQREKIRRFDLSGHFDPILIEGEVGYGKPDTRIFQIALDSLKSVPQNTWMIGDNIVWDVVAPQEIGMKGIWIDSYGSNKHSDRHPFFVLRAVPEILNHINF